VVKYRRLDPVGLIREPPRVKLSIPAKSEPVDDI
jgi:hypothetical protein